MTAKEYLNRMSRLDAIINSRLREAEYWRTMSGSISGGTFEQHYNPNRPTDAPFVRCLEKIDEIERDIDRRVDELVDLKNKVNRAIDDLDSWEEQLLLRYRYLENLPWDEIRCLLHVSNRTMHSIHASALQNFVIPD